MDPKDTNIENKRGSYFDEETQSIDFHSFYEDIFLGYNPEQLKVAMDRIKEETANIEMGSTTKSNLDRSTNYLASLGIETQDESQAKDISILRVLKMLPGLSALTDEEIKNFLPELIKRYTLSSEEEYVRETINNGMTLDQHMRVHGSPINIQKHITISEMGSVLGKVRDILQMYISNSLE